MKPQREGENEQRGQGGGASSSVQPREMLPPLEEGKEEGKRVGVEQIRSANLEEPLWMKG